MALLQTGCRWCEPYAWYIRVADLPAFLMHIRPALEARLAKSALCGFSGSIKLTYYQKQGQEWTFENGKLTGIEAIDLMWSKADCAFPGLTILQLVFGYRSLKELRYAHADCWTGERSSQLLNALFPAALPMYGQSASCTNLTGRDLMSQSSKPKFSNNDRERSQRRRQRVLFGILAFLLIISWILSLVIVQ